MKPLTTITDPRFVKALAHPLRVQILAILEERTASPKEIADELDASLGVVSYHVRQLAAFGVIKLVKRTPRRGAIEHHYRLEARPSISDEAWAEAPEIAKQALIGAVLRQVSTQVNAAAANAGFSRDGTHLSRLPLELDKKGWDEVSKAMSDFVERLSGIQKNAKKRSAKGHGDDLSAMAVLMLFEASDAAVPEPDNPGGNHAKRAATRRRTKAHTS
ncbi:MAG TPA: winged helix-turn-helix domain-containing protein [Thermoleophilaceae bacterium]|jgi:DNA-binding transcriptional ArsR family regulator